MSRLLFIFFLVLIHNDSYSQTVSSYTVHNCKYEGVGSGVQNRIISKETFNDSIKIKLGVVANCAVDSSYQLFFNWEEKNIMNISIEFKGIDVSCSCYYELETTIINSIDSNLIIKYYDEELYLSPYLHKVVPIEFDIYQGDTVNYISRFGFKDGLHIYQNDAGTVVYERLYNKGRTLWVKYYTEKGKLEEVLYVENGERLEFNKNQFKRYLRKKNRQKD